MTRTQGPHEPAGPTAPARRFEGQVVLVTGAGRGIGAAIARAFAAEGATVAVNYLARHDTAAQVVADCQALGGDAIALQADVGSPAQVQAMIDALALDTGRLDVVVNNALGAYSFDPHQRRSFEQVPWADYQRQFEAAVGGTHHVCRAALPLLQRTPGGRIVNIVSDLVEQPVVAYHDYSTAKSALVGFSRQLAAELGPLGIRVNCVAPGLVYPTQASQDTRDSFRAAIAAATPLRRIARPEDVAGPVLFLGSDWSRFMTGQVLFVDGGLVMR